jgi:hypothetical protein
VGLRRGALHLHRSTGRGANRERGQVGDRYMRRRVAISREIDLDRHQMLCDRRTHRLGAVGFRNLPGVEDSGHQRAITLPDDVVPAPGRPTNITPGTARLRRAFTTSDPSVLIIGPALISVGEREQFAQALA